MKIGDMIFKYRTEHSMSMEEFAKKADVSKPYISMLEKGINHKTGKPFIPTVPTLKRLAKALNISFSDLLKTLDANFLIKLEDASPTFQIKTAAMVPVIGSVRCGPGGPAYEYIDEYVSVDDSYRNPAEIRGFRATGDSMEGDGIKDGDICLVRLQDEVEDGQIAVVVLCNGEESEGMIKRVRKDRGMVILQSSNPAYPPRIITGEEANSVHIVGRVVEVRHKY